MVHVRIFAALLLCSAASFGAARPSLSKAEAVVAASKRATGGARWDKPQGCTERGTHGNGAVSYLTRFSLNAYGMRTDGERGGAVRSTGFDGHTSWQAAGGKIDARSDPAAVQEAVVTNYLSINGFFFPRRFPASFRYVKAASEGARRFDVLEITPKGGRPLEIWFDRRTHLVQRVVDVEGTPRVRVEASDYRRGADGLTIAYRLDVFGPDGTALDKGVVLAFECGSIDPKAFAPPAE